MNAAIQPCVWRLRRVAAGLRQLDVCFATGISQARYSLYERGDAQPSERERAEIERVLPLLSVEVKEHLLEERRS